MKNWDEILWGFCGMKAAIHGGCGLEDEEEKNLTEIVLPIFGLSWPNFDEGQIDLIGLYIASNVVSGIESIDIDYYFHDWDVSTIESLKIWMYETIRHYGLMLNVISVDGKITDVVSVFWETHFWDEKDKEDYSVILITEDEITAKYGLSDSFWTSHIEGIGENSTIMLLECISL